MRTETDICLILEGTYPFVTGGVSNWIHQLILSLPKFTFSLAVILPDRKADSEYKYHLPENVRTVKKIFLHDYKLPASKNDKLTADKWQDVDLYHHCPFSREKYATFESIFYNFFDNETRGIAPAEIADSKFAWTLLEKLFGEKAHDASFIDYFWTFRFTHLPVFKILTSEIPTANVYHSLSTGYAGLLAIAAKLKNKRPVILTEHGIYARERRIEISRSEWIHEPDSDRVKIVRSQGRFKELWNQLFNSLSRLIYHYADVIITLSATNQKYQEQDGADPKKMKLIPNAVSVGEFYGISQKSDFPDSRSGCVLGFMGRVVPVKDVKTFIRVCKHVSQEIPNLKAYIMGSTLEDPFYYQECQKLCKQLDLQETVEFTGEIDAKEYYPKIDILVLTSLSEAQPLVILEANAAGIPVVATDVGSCKEMLYGKDSTDRKLGKSGLVAGITDSAEIGQAVVKIWRSPELRNQMSEAGKTRVRKYYNREKLIQDYCDLYNYYRKI